MPESAILLKQWYDMQIPALPFGSTLAAAEQPGFWAATDGKGEYTLCNVVNAGNAPSQATDWTMKFYDAYTKRWNIEPEGLGTSSSYDVSLGDVDDDGDLDAFVVNGAGQANLVWLNDGSGTYSDSGQSLGTSTSYDVSLGDMDADGDVDQTDFGQFQACFTGPGNTQHKPGCLLARLDLDEDVDIEDFTVFEACMSGADMPADPDCGNPE